MTAIAAKMLKIISKHVYKQNHKFTVYISQLAASTTSSLAAFAVIFAVKTCFLQIVHNLNFVL